MSPDVFKHFVNFPRVFAAHFASSVQASHSIGAKADAALGWVWDGDEGVQRESMNLGRYPMYFFPKSLMFFVVFYSIFCVILLALARGGGGLGGQKYTLYLNSLSLLSHKFHGNGGVFSR